uniref:Uncharacterized protein n=1 Tax=Spongospora subterranea TaxID=70186 RepID=A0A0H5R8H8_9EUKA|eukprot:CRZ04654.1 hypothetical protein [Spongospora subterranea]
MTPVVDLVRQYLMQGYLAKGVQNLSAAINPSAALLKALAISGSFEIRRRRYINKDYLDTQVIADNSAPDKYQGFGRLKLNRVLNFADNAAKHTTYAPRVRLCSV